MNYGYVTDKLILEMSDKICSCLGFGNDNHSYKLLIETAIAETGLGRIEDKTILGGMGITQFDKMPFEDVKKRSAKHKDKVLKELKVNINLVEWEHLRYNPYLSLIFTRLKYKLVIEATPQAIEERAEYWKKYYNRTKGKGTEKHYLEMNIKYNFNTLDI